MNARLMVALSKGKSTPLIMIHNINVAKKPKINVFQRALIMHQADKKWMDSTQSMR